MSLFSFHSRLEFSRFVRKVISHRSFIKLCELFFNKSFHKNNWFVKISIRRSDNSLISNLDSYIFPNFGCNPTHNGVSPDFFDKENAVSLHNGRTHDPY